MLSIRAMIFETMGDDAMRAVLCTLVAAAGCSLLLPGRGEPSDGGPADGPDGGAAADGDPVDGSEADGGTDTATFSDADADGLEDGGVGDADDGGSDADGDGSECASEELCTECAGDRCLGACEDEDCDGFSLACAGSDSGDERLYVEPPVAGAGDPITIRVCSVVHRHPCVFVICTHPSAGDAVRLVHATTESEGDERCWSFTADPEGEAALEISGRWTCTFFSKTDVDESCEGGTELAHACGVVDVHP